MPLIYFLLTSMAGALSILLKIGKREKKYLVPWFMSFYFILPFSQCVMSRRCPYNYGFVNQNNALPLCGASTHHIYMDSEISGLPYSRSYSQKKKGSQYQQLM